MKTIELTCGEKKVQFTTKSVTFDGNEYFYSNMSNVSHNAEECFYTFTYDGEIKTLPYEAKDVKILAAIFNQVMMLEAKKAEAQAAAAEAAKKMAPADVTETAAEPEPVLETEDAAEQAPEAKVTDNEAAEAVTAEEDELSAEEKKAAKKAAKEQRKAEKLAEKERRKTEKLAKKENNDNAGEVPAEYNQEADPEKSARKKKSLIIFGIILVVFAVVSAIYFFVFGTSEDPSDIAPNATETQQYDEIDDVINDLQ